MHGEICDIGLLLVSVVGHLFVGNAEDETDL